jgi:hypothetical protein
MLILPTAIKKYEVSLVSNCTSFTQTVATVRQLVLKLNWGTHTDRMVGYKGNRASDGMTYQVSRKQIQLSVFTRATDTRTRTYWYHRPILICDVRKEAKNVFPNDAGRMCILKFLIMLSEVTMKNKIQSSLGEFHLHNIQKFCPMKNASLLYQ